MDVPNNKCCSLNRIRIVQLKKNENIDKYLPRKEFRMFYHMDETTLDYREVLADEQSHSENS